jgi:hypothetical protein
MTPEKPHANASSSDTTPMSTLRCLKMRFSVSSRSRSSTTFRNGSHHACDIVDELLRQILMHAADAEVLGVHARAGRALVEHHQLFALLEAPQRRRQRADVHRLRRDVQKMRQDAADLGIEHADQLAAARHFEPSSFSPPGRRRAPGSSARRNRAGRNSRSPADRSYARSASRCRGDAADRRCGSTRSTTSPSSSSTKRNTPCACRMLRPEVDRR